MKTTKNYGIGTMRLVMMAAALAMIIGLPQRTAAAPAASPVGCGGANVCCGDVGDLTCISYVTNAIATCCGGNQASGNSSCWGGTFYVYCNPGGYKYCECDSNGNGCTSGELN